MRKIFILLLFLPVFLEAQTDESDTLNTDTLKFKADLSLTGFWQSGNVNTLIFRAKADLKWKPLEKLQIRSQNSYLYQEFGKEKADEDILSLNFIEYNPEKRFFPLAIGIVSSNFRREINVRYILGAGVTYKVIDKDNEWVKFSVSWEYENTNFRKNSFNFEEYEGQNQINTVRNTIWMSGKKKLFKEKLSLGLEAYFQPSLQDGNNYRWQADFSAEVPITNRLNFKINYLHTYERIVVEDQKQQDGILTFGVSWKNYTNK